MCFLKEIVALPSCDTESLILTRTSSLDGALRGYKFFPLVLWP